MTRSARRRAALANLAPSTLSAYRQEAVKECRRTRKKAVHAFFESLANPDSAVVSALYKVSCTLADEASWDACSALALEASHYSCKRKPGKQARLLN